MARFSMFSRKDPVLQLEKVHDNTGNNEDKREFSSIYCLKTLGAFFVICIHCYEPWLIFPIIRTAVPIFFIISGFFLYRDDSDKAIEKCIVTFKKIFWITLYANFFYYIAYCLPTDFCPFKTVRSLIEYIVFGDKFGVHLWYLNAYLETLVVVTVALKLRILNQVWYFIPFCIFIGLILGKYEFLFPSLPNYIPFSRNFVTTGIPCFGIGWLLKKYNGQLLRIVNLPILLTLIILFLSIGEIMILKYTNHFIDGDYIITTFLLAASIVLFALKFPSIGKNSIIELIGKKYSTYIYIFHVFLWKMFFILNENLFNLPDFTFPFIVFVLTLFFIVIWQKCSRNML